MHSVHCGSAGQMPANTESFWFEYSTYVSGIGDPGFLTKLCSVALFSKSCVFVCVYSSRSKKKKIVFPPIFTAVGRKRTRWVNSVVTLVLQRWSYLDQHFYAMGSSTTQIRDDYKRGRVVMVTTCHIYGKQWRGKLYRGRMLVWVCSNKWPFHTVTCKAINQGASGGDHMDRVMAYRPENNDFQKLCGATVN